MPVVMEVLEMYWGISAASLVMLCTLLMGVACIDCVQLMRPSIRYQHNPAAFCNIQELAEQVQAVKQKVRVMQERRGWLHFEPPCSFCRHLKVASPPRQADVHTYKAPLKGRADMRDSNARECRMRKQSDGSCW